MAALAESPGPPQSTTKVTAPVRTTNAAATGPPATETAATQNQAGPSGVFERLWGSRAGPSGTFERLWGSRAGKSGAFERLWRF